MAVFTDDLRSEGEMAGNTLRASNGKHGEANFDSTTNRRTAQSVIHEHKIAFRLADGVDVTTQDAVVDVALHNCEVVEVCVWPEVAPVDTGTPGTDKKYTVDVLKTVIAGAFASIMSAVVTVDGPVGVDRTAQYGTIDSTKKDLTRSSALKVQVTASGSTGTQGQGGVIVIKVREHPEA